MHKIWAYIQKRHLELAILIATLLFGVAATCIGVQSLDLQRSAAEQAAYPFFHYTYSNGLFQVEGSEDVDITHVDWQLQDDPYAGETGFPVAIINGLPLALSTNELRDFFANRLGLNLLTNNYASDLIECNFYSSLALTGIPALVSVTYDRDNQQGLKAKDFVLITRLDTPDPEIVVPDGGRNVQTDQQIVALFGKYQPLVDTAMTQVEKLPKSDPNYKGQLRANGRCGISIDQPIGGY